MPLLVRGFYVFFSFMGALFSKWCEDIKIKITIKSFFESILDVFTEFLSILDFLKHHFFKLLIIHFVFSRPSS